MENDFKWFVWFPILTWLQNWTLAWSFCGCLRTCHSWNSWMFSKCSCITWCAFPCQLDSFGPIATGCQKDLSHGGPAPGKMRQQDGLQVRGSLSGRSCHCLVYRDASEYPMPPVFILGTLRLLDHVSLSLSLSFTRSYYKTKTATSIVNQKEVIRIGADTSMISLKSNFKVTRSIESIHSAFGFTGQGQSGGAAGSCPGFALGPEVSEVPTISKRHARQVPKHFHACSKYVPNMYLFWHQLIFAILYLLLILSAIKKTTQSHLFIVTEPDDLDAQVTTNLVDSIRHEMMKALTVNDSTLH